MEQAFTEFVESIASTPLTKAVCIVQGDRIGMAIKATFVNKQVAYINRANHLIGFFNASTIRFIPNNGAGALALMGMRPNALYVCRYVTPSIVEKLTINGANRPVEIWREGLPGSLTFSRSFEYDDLLYDPNMDSKE